MRILQSITLVASSLILSSVSWSADFAKGNEAYLMGDYQAAMAEWQPLAEAGEATSQFGMGLLYANGFGVALNDDQALKWYGLAADQGHPQAQCNLAVMYENGWGVPQSNEAALNWYLLAAEQGVTPAQISVAKMYRDGFAVGKDHVMSRKWFAIATRLGDSNASVKLEDLALMMSAEELAEGDELANAWMNDHQNLQANE